jgi:hypothetical protein
MMHGFGLNEKWENQLEVLLEQLFQMLSSPGCDQRRVTDLSDELLRLTLKIRAVAGSGDAELASGECDRIDDAGAVYGGISNEEIWDVWKQQQIVNAREALNILEGEPKDVLAQRVRAGLDDRIARPTALLEALGEIKKVALLLTGSEGMTELRIGDQVFTDDMLNGPDQWQPFGDHRLTQTPEGLRYLNTGQPYHDTMMWTRRSFEHDHVLQLTMKPNTEPGGVILALCGKPRPGKDLSESAKVTMEPYNHGIDAYHASVHRVGTGVSNLRRPGHGLKMLATVSPDPCEEANRWYHIEMLKWRNNLMFFVDGRLIHHYYDGGVYGAPLDGGHIGIRHWRQTDATYRDVRVSRLTAAPLDGCSA